MHIARELFIRILAGAAVLWAAASLAFAVLQLFPSDPVQVIYGADSSVTPELRAAIRADFGLDQPVLVQYQRFVTRIAQGDLGISYQQRRTVASIIGSEIGSTLTLASLAVLAAVAMAFLASLLTAGRPGLLRRALSSFELLSVSTPVLWVGILLLTFFSFQWQLFPVVADAGWRSLVLPVATLSIAVFGSLSQVMREEMDRALEQPFILTARTRGLSEWAIRWKHALGHALIPAITISTETFGGLLAGSIVTEQVFGRPGLGRITLEAITNHDIPVVMGIVLFVAFVFVALNILADLLYRLVDPRLRVSSR
ncbi:ABC transporter permease [Microvirga solisilvae]|uniref:ABC transporter permease n=1 Tax=Microvirga solisilvae TaxID=2919498 RepID=UPI001FAFC5D4|nr:ABC transporter permease [Microvirga solisilvae]